MNSVGERFEQVEHHRPAARDKLACCHHTGTCEGNFELIKIDQRAVTQTPRAADVRRRQDRALCIRALQRREARRHPADLLVEHVGFGEAKVLYRFARGNVRQVTEALDRDAFAFELFPVDDLRRHEQ